VKGFPSWNNREGVNPHGIIVKGNLMESEVEPQEDPHRSGDDELEPQEDPHRSGDDDDARHPTQQPIDRGLADLVVWLVLIWAALALILILLFGAPV
jgi:hypothetical protein